MRHRHRESYDAPLLPHYPYPLELVFTLITSWRDAWFLLIYGFGDQCGRQGSDHYYQGTLWCGAYFLVFNFFGQWLFYKQIHGRHLLKIGNKRRWSRSSGFCDMTVIWRGQQPVQTHHLKGIAMKKDLLLAAAAHAGLIPIQSMVCMVLKVTFADCDDWQGLEVIPV